MTAAIRWKSKKWGWSYFVLYIDSKVLCIQLFPTVGHKELQKRVHFIKVVLAISWFIGYLGDVY